MQYPQNDNKLLLIIKHIAALIALLVMVGLFIYVILDDFKITQKQVTIVLDVKNKVNICLPETDEFDQKSFFNF